MDDLDDLMDIDPEDSSDDNLNELFEGNADQGYYVAMFLQRIIASGEINDYSSLRDPSTFRRPELPVIKQPPVLKKLKRNAIYRAIQEASGLMQLVDNIRHGGKQPTISTPAAIADAMAPKKLPPSLKTTPPQRSAAPATRSSSMAATTSTSTRTAAAEETWDAITTPTLRGSAHPSASTSSSPSASSLQSSSPPSSSSSVSSQASFASSSSTPSHVGPPTAASASLLRLIMSRERGTGLKHASFTEPQRCGINNMHTPNSFKPLMKLQAKVYCGAMSSNGQHFVSASQDHVLRVLDASRDTYRNVNRIEAKDVHWGILDIAFNSRGDEFVYSTWSTCLQLSSINGDSNDIQSLNMQPFTPRFCIFSVAFSGCDRHIIGGSSDGCLYVFDRECNERTMRIPVAFKAKRSFREEKSDVNTVGFMDDASNIIFTGLDNGAIRLWDRRTMDETRYEPVGYFTGHVDGITHIDSKMDGRYLISNSKDQSIKLWDIRSFGQRSHERAAIRMRQSSRMELDWDYRWDEVPHHFYESSVTAKNDNSIMTYRGHRVRKSLLRAKFSPAETTGQRYIYTGCSTGHLIIYDLLTGDIVKKIDGHTDVVRDVSWHPSRQEILTSSWDGCVNLNRFTEPSVEEELLLDRRARKRPHRQSQLDRRLDLARISALRRSQRIAEQRARRDE